jgi:ketosteroid isomerase-like protein
MIVGRAAQIRGRLAGISLLTLLAACGGQQQPREAAPSAGPANERAQIELAQVEVAWGRALEAHDTAFFRETLADDFIATGGPTVLTKAEFLADLGSAKQKPLPYRLEDTRVRIYGDVGIVTGLITFENPTGPAGPPSRYTEVWVRRNGRWQAVHGHYNPVLPPGPNEAGAADTIGATPPTQP